MTEYEYLDLLVTLKDSCGFHGMNYIAILFAYLVAGFFAGRLLSRFQVMALTLFYIMLCPLPGIGTWEAVKDYSALAVEYREKFQPGAPLPLFAQHGAQLWIFTFIGTLLLSIYFMAQSRHASGQEANPAQRADAFDA